MPACLYVACLLALLMATAASANDTDVINACLKSAYSGDHGEAHACIGIVADPCLQKPENQSTQSMVACTDTETKIWDGLLNAEYERLLGALQGKAADDVRQAQRVWITLRDADCAVPYELFDGGTMAQPIGANCLLSHTANRMMQVRSWREMVQPEQE